MSPGTARYGTHQYKISGSVITAPAFVCHLEEHAMERNNTKTRGFVSTAPVFTCQLDQHAMEQACPRIINMRFFYLFKDIPTRTNV